jgi:hypothetical protein
MSLQQVFEKLAEVQEKHPREFNEVIAEHPEWFNAIRDWKREQELILNAQLDNPTGYAAHYEGIHGMNPPFHVAMWIIAIYKAHDEGLGFSLNGFRGSWKSSALSVDFVSFRISKEPFKTNLVVCAAEPTADKITKAIADIIEFNPFWKKAYPNVIPIEGKWSSDGYWVIDTKFSREEWSGKMAGQIDPTLLGGGYTSTKINGRHPSGVLLADDMHDLNNSLSDNERKFVVKFFTTILMKTVIRVKDKLDTWVVNIGIPYGIDDIHQTAKQSGGFLTSTLPVMVKAKEGDKDAVYIDGINKQTGIVYEDIVGWWILTWGEKFGIDTIIKERGLGKQDFWQQMMMDLQGARSGGLRYYSYPHGDIDKNWLCSTGVDPSWTFRERKEIFSNSSFFSMCHTLVIPRGGAVIAGGKLEQCTDVESAGLLLSSLVEYPNTQNFYVEDVGVGLIYQKSISRLNPKLASKIIASDLGGIRMKGEKRAKAKNKDERARREFAPFLESAIIFISDERTDYLDTLRDALDNISEMNYKLPDKKWDALDGAYHSLKGIPQVLYQKPLGEDLSQLFTKKKAPHPLAGR